MIFLRHILFPFVPIYYFVTWLRNKLYDSGIKRSISYDFPVICVGNLSVGGTGKTPMIEYLINLLKEDYRVATLSRGYKRKTKGFLLADKYCSAESIGDEPFQFFNKYKKSIFVAVDANRINGIEQLKLIKTPPEVILLDDAFQHRKVKAGFNILLTTYNCLYSRDYVLPSGNLREPRSGAKRANIIIVTKCPDNLAKEEINNITRELNPEINQKVFFSSIVYSQTIYARNREKFLNDLESFTLVTGIANPVPMVKFLNSHGLRFDHLNYKDHHEFSSKEIDVLNKKELIITTEKDFMRLRQYELLSDKLYYLPIKVTILNSNKFNKILLNYIKN